jgi:hypothetical protein
MRQTISRAWAVSFVLPLVAAPLAVACLAACGPAPAPGMTEPPPADETDSSAPVVVVAQQIEAAPPDGGDGAPSSALDGTPADAAAPAEDASVMSQDPPADSDGGAAPEPEASANDGPNEGAAGEAEASVVVEAGEAAPPACPSGELMCSGQCTALATDTNNCGACGRSCAPGNCSAGQCLSWVVVSSDTSFFGCDGAEVAWAQPTITDLLEAPADGSANHHSGIWFQASPGRGSGEVFGVTVASGVTAWTATDPGGNGNALIAGTAQGAYGQVIRAGFGTPTGVALDSAAANAYFGTISGSSTAEIWQCSLVGGATPCTSLASFTSSQLASVAVDDSYVYWTDPGNNVVSRESLTGGSVSTLATGQGKAGALAVDAKNVYWTAVVPSKTVVRVLAKGATSSSTLATSPGGIAAIATDGTHLYFSTPDGVVQSVPAAGGDSAKLFSIAGTTGGYAVITTLVYASGAVFWNDLLNQQIDGLRVF